MRSKTPYLKNDFTNFIRKEWSLFDGDKGCEAVTLEGARLCMDKSPPLLPSEKVALAEKQQSAPATKAAGKPDATAATTVKEADLPIGIAAWRQLTGQLDAKDASKAKDKKQVKGFDLYDMPIAMKAEPFPKAAKFNLRWLDGRPYTAYHVDPASGDEIEGRYDVDMIDTDTVTLSWLLKLPAIQQRFEELQASFETPSAIKILRKRLTEFVKSNFNFSGDLDTWAYCHGDLQDLHQQFQFQFANVSMLDTLLPLSWDAARRYGKNLGMSDVSAALGNFAFYASVARAHINRQMYPLRTPNGNVYCVRPIVTITHVDLYARDSYSFYDKGKASQYLGHWNKTGVIILPNAAAASWGMKKVMDGHDPDSLWDQQFEIGNDPVVDVFGFAAEKGIYYPIRNRDYLRWRELHNRGGDFLIYSDFKRVKLRQPIVVDLGEICPS